MSPEVDLSYVVDLFVCSVVDTVATRFTSLNSHFQVLFAVVIHAHYVSTFNA